MSGIFGAASFDPLAAAARGRELRRMTTATDELDAFSEAQLLDFREYVCKCATGVSMVQIARFLCTLSADEAKRTADMMSAGVIDEYIPGRDWRTGAWRSMHHPRAGWSDRLQYHRTDPPGSKLTRCRHGGVPCRNVLHQSERREQTGETRETRERGRQERQRTREEIEDRRAREGR